MLDAERYQRAKTIFHDACAQPRDCRDSFINRACAGDADLGAAVRQLLAHDDDPMSMINPGRVREHLEHMAGSASGEGTSDRQAPPDPALPSHIGRYHVLSRLGAGGMGVVYLAEQDNPRRQVALKVIAPGQSSGPMLRRFGHEAQILGRLHHPGIAQVYEAGMHDSGQGAQPYFAMEMVRGRPLVQYCEHANADRRTRLVLFIAICDAVQHAHQHGVVHRDLKPANILVEQRDEAAQRDQVQHAALAHPTASLRLPVSTLPRIKILDFGVARLIDSDVQATTMHTAADQLVGTVAYMSPEQMSGRPEDIDTRSDVYALGVILFELLAGRLPHDVLGKSIPEMIRALSEREPTTLSSIDRTCRGDLDTIVGKAMERDKSRRYQSAGELAADVRRYLDDHPIHARPPSTLYQMHKFARRNKALVGGAVAVFVALVGGMITTTWQWRQAIAARDEQVNLRKEADDNAALATTEAEKAKAVNAFLTRMLASANPDVTQGRDVLVGEVLDAAARELAEGAFNSQPEVLTQVHMTIGDTYQSIGRVEQAQHHYEQALALSRREEGRWPDEEAAALIAIGTISSIRGDREQAWRLTEQALEILTRAHGQEDREDVAACLSGLAECAANEGRMADAIELQRRALGMLQRLHTGDDTEVARVQARLAGMLHNPAEAEPLVRAALRMFEAAGETHPSHVQALRTLADVMAMRGAFDDAEATYRRALDLGIRVYGRDHYRNLVTLANLSLCLRLARRPEAYAEVCDEMVPMSSRMYGDRSMRLVEALLDRGDVRAVLGRDAESEADYRQAMAIVDEGAEAGDVRGCIARIGVACAIVRRGGDVNEVESLATAVLAFQDQFRGEQRWLAGQSICLLGEVAFQRGALQEAERLLLDGYQRLGTSALVRNQRAAAAERLARVYQAIHTSRPDSGYAEEAERWRMVQSQLTASAVAPATQPSPIVDQDRSN